MDPSSELTGGTSIKLFQQTRNSLVVWATWRWCPMGKKPLHESTDVQTSVCFFLKSSKIFQKCNSKKLLACMHACMISHFSCVRLFATLWTVAHQPPLSMGLTRQECWSGLPYPSPGIKPGLLCLLHWQSGSLPLAPPGKSVLMILSKPVGSVFVHNHISDGASYSV